MKLATLFPELGSMSVGEAHFIGVAILLIILIAALSLTRKPPLQ